ncbi:MAG: adenylate cyclase [Candidatus Binatia bacterium]|jgi:adenylate cyclase
MAGSDTTDTESFKDALAAEKLRRARTIASLRAIIICLNLALVTTFWLTLPNWVGPLESVAVYAVAALAAYLASRRSDGLAWWSAALIPVVDMPMLFWISTQIVSRLEAVGAAADAHGWRFATAAFFALLILLAALSLERRGLVAATVVAVLLQSILLRAGGTIDLTQQVVIPLALVLTAVLADYANRRAIALVGAANNEHARRRRLARYFAPQVAAHIDSFQGDLAAGERREVTVLFSDLCDFTKLSETLTEHETVALLNAVHERLIGAVFRHEGTLDKLMGDGLMAYFGAPIPQGDHAKRAIDCGLEMVDAIAELSRERERSGQSALKVGVGIHTGDVVLGDIGAEQRRDFTAVGDAVNVASRIERLTRERDGDVLVSQSTKDASQSDFAFRPVEPAQVKGKTDALQCYVPSSLA